MATQKTTKKSTITKTPDVKVGEKLDEIINGVNNMSESLGTMSSLAMGLLQGAHDAEEPEITIAEPQDAADDTTEESTFVVLPVISDIESDHSLALIYEITKFVLTYPLKTASYKSKTKNPYHVPTKAPAVLELQIAAPEMSPLHAQRILSLMSMARARGMIIRTNIMSDLFDFGAQVAIQGTHGYRIMHQDTVIVPWHNIIDTNDNVMGFGPKNLKNDFTRYGKHLVENWQGAYIRSSKLTPDEIKNLCAKNATALSAEQCLQHGLVDWILTRDGKYINKLQKQK